MKYILYFLIGIVIAIIINHLLVKSLAVHYVAPVATSTPSSVKSSSKLPPVKRKPTEAQIALVNEKASEYGVSADLMMRIISCESDFNPTARGDGGYSRGLVQIHAKYHPDVTYEEATNEEFAVEFLAEKLSQDQGYLWTCWRLITRS